MDRDVPITIGGLRAAYRSRAATPDAVMSRILTPLAASQGSEAWIFFRDHETLMHEARACTARLSDPDALQKQPLLGIPFAVKDNIDVAGIPTTAACPAYAHTPATNAAVVERLLAAGALLLGKTNLDQFATGLVGTRSPYGAVRNPFNPAYMSGGSSSGSAAVVARGWAAFALGTDTAGSGRIPAGACNLVGIKPTPGLVSTAGVLPACRTLDCVSIFGHTVEDGWLVLQLLAGQDPADEYSRAVPPLGPVTRRVRLGVPRQPEFFGDDKAQAAWQQAVNLVTRDDAVALVPIDMQPFHDVAQLLYDGPWVAERRAAITPFMDDHPADMDPVVHGIIARADAHSAADAFRGFYALEQLRPACLRAFEDIDILMVPTAPTIYRHDDIAREPVLFNARLGLYTNFVNLLGMAGLALPGPFRADGLPAGITLLGPAGSDHRLAAYAQHLQPVLHARLGRSGTRVPVTAAPVEPLPFAETQVVIAVVGAHLSGLPLNWQLTERCARRLEKTHTARCYRLYALPGSAPAKPGLVRDETQGEAIEVELWTLPERLFGGFVAGIPSPLGIGTLQLADGRRVPGFLCESWAIDGAEEITRYGGWKAYLASRQAIPAATPLLPL